VGNHDISPASGRAHTLQEFDTLQVPNVRVLHKPELLKPADLWGLPLQVLSLPWVFRSTLMAALQLSVDDNDSVNEEIEKRITLLLENRMQELDPQLPTIFTAHGSVQGAVYGNERTVMLGKDLVLPGGLVKDPRLDYVALGHIHKHQDLNPGAHPPVVYPGSIERVDFGEAADDKGFVLAEIEKGNTSWRFVKIAGRAFHDRLVKVSSREEMNDKVLAALPAEERITDAIIKLTVEYPRELEMFLDEGLLREKCASALEFHLIRRPQEEARLRLPADQSIASLSPMELLSRYWSSIHTEPGQFDHLQSTARSIIHAVSGSGSALDPDESL
jgi:exonuclease SbcD